METQYETIVALKRDIQKYKALRYKAIVNSEDTSAIDLKLQEFEKALVESQEKENDGNIKKKEREQNEYLEKINNVTKRSLTSFKKDVPQINTLYKHIKAILKTEEVINYDPEHHYPKITITSTNAKISTSSHNSENFEIDYELQPTLKGFIDSVKITKLEYWPATRRGPSSDWWPDINYVIRRFFNGFAHMMEVNTEDE